MDSFKVRSSGELDTGHLQLFECIIVWTFAFLGSPESYMTLSPICCWIGPRGSLLSNQSYVLLPLPIMCLKCGRKRGCNCSSFHQDQELFTGMGMSQRDFPLRRFALAQAA